MRDIKEFEGRYAITENGEVWSYKHKKFLKPKLVNGYYTVDLFKNGQGTKYPMLVHRLVAMTYIANPDNLPEVNHKDECKTNNCVSNLEWCTHKYNMNYGTRTQRAESNKTAEMWKRIRGASAFAHRKMVICVETGVIYNSVSEAADALKVSASHISSCCRGKRKACGGYHWEYYVCEEVVA